MKYLVPPIVIPGLLFIGIAAYAMLRPPIIVGHVSQLYLSAVLSRLRARRWSGDR
jgi:hypothetical protein